MVKKFTCSRKLLWSCKACNYEIPDSYSEKHVKWLRGNQYEGGNATRITIPKFSTFGFHFATTGCSVEAARAIGAVLHERLWSDAGRLRLVRGATEPTLPRSMAN